MNRNHNRKLFILALAVLLGIAHIPQAFALSDKIIKQRIEDTAVNTSELRGTKVDVAVEDGFVVLSGMVRLYSQKMMYDRIAWQTMGVSEVENEIRVVPVMPLADAAIERKIKEIVTTYSSFHCVLEQIRVAKGSVFLRVTLDHPRDLRFLKQDVAEIEGVVAIEIFAAFRV